MRLRMIQGGKPSRVEVSPGWGATRRGTGLCGLLLLAACAGVPSPDQRRAQAEQLASAAGWYALPIRTADFELLSYVPARFVAGGRLTVYLEGDGFAWRTPYEPSQDPTPRDPLALRLALAHPQGNAAYLGRPCQYRQASAPSCPQQYWTDARFAPEVVQSTQAALETLKSRAGATRLTLVGYSGGGGLAALVAAARNDVDRLITVAGNLDHAAWTSHHGMTPLTHSLNAAAVAPRLADVPQMHFVGARDPVIPPGLARAFPQPFIGTAGERLRILDGFDHRCCWVQAWPELWREATEP